MTTKWCPTPPDPSAPPSPKGEHSDTGANSHPISSVSGVWRTARRPLGLLCSLAHREQLELAERTGVREGPGYPKRDEGKRNRRTEWSTYTDKTGLPKGGLRVLHRQAGTSGALP